MKTKKLEGGLRTKGKSKTKPLITIVTVVRNGEKTLERTIKGVINQTYKNIEYIIIDGNSTDKTLDIIKKYENKIDYWMSEPDKGIYDAMNKGILLAKGEYIQFLNSDDYFVSNESLRNIVRFLDKKVDIFSCRVSIGEKGRFLSYFPKKILNLNNLKKGNTLAHPATFMKKKVFVELDYFNTNYKIASDYDIICKCFLGGYNILQDNHVIVQFDLSGISSVCSFLSLKEVSSIIRKHFGRLYSIPYFCKRFSYISLEKIFKFFGIFEIFRNVKYKLLK